VLRLWFFESGTWPHWRVCFQFRPATVQRPAQFVVASTRRVVCLVTFYYTKGICDLVHALSRWVIKSSTFSKMNPNDTRKHGSMDADSHPGPTSFADFAQRSVRRMTTVTSNADSIMDIETINWRIFFTRIFLIILLVLVVVCLGLYDLNPGFLFLAIFILGFLILCLVATFVDLGCICRRCSYCRSGTSGESNNATSKSTTLQQETSAPAPSVEAHVESPFGNYHNKL
jgi:hypothetical protein